ncbi:hypothetical protein HYFRA_00013344 [Hymenoscyphus fraxineus]|uniref:Uncharacterized protein n=1 Tax=Hymenoscyphus fraxineus TaxID=746836 RepID=A0A9N9LAA3_9HELO|nr:hypothetical protein HYFRA_00013344 [Hymenoscyphus fraxineus]
MQFSKLLACAFLATSAVADLKIRGICTSRSIYWNLFFFPDRDATIKACDAYKARNTGTNKEDTCPDCTFEDRVVTPNCYSANEHIGGEEP